MARTDVKITMDSSISKGPHLGHHLMDFANMLKAFIGSNYLAIAFAFRQSGIALGLVGLTLIATLTAHCCQLLVRCKYHTIQHLLVSMGHSKGNKLQLQGEKLHPHSNGSPPSSSSSASSDEESSNESEDDYDAVHKKLLRNLNFGDIGRLCMGRAGLTLVNSAVIVTQFGFCVGYCIFVGNTIHSMFPLYNCSVSVSVARPNVSDVIHQCLEVKHLNSLNSVHVDMGDMVERVPGVLHNKRFLSALGEDGFPGQVKDTTVVPTPPEMLSSFVDFLASDKVSILHATSTTDIPSNHTTAGFQKVTGTTRTSPADLDKMPNSSKNNTAPDDGNPFSGSNTTKIDNTLPISRNNSTKSDNRVPILDNNNTGDNKTTSGSVMPNVTSTEHPSVSEISMTVGYVTTARTVPVNGTRWTLLRGKHIPDLKLLVLLPVVLFVPMTLIRNLRHLGFISIIANAAIFIGCIEVFLFLISAYHRALGDVIHVRRPSLWSFLRVLKDRQHGEVRHRPHVAGSGASWRPISSG